MSYFGTAVNPTPAREKILLVGMLNSVHFARWVRLFENSEVDFYLFPSTMAQELHPIIQRLASERGESKLRIFYKQKPRLVWRAIWFIDLLFDNSFRGWLLNRSITTIQPKIVHTLEFQHAGYLALKAIRTKPKFDLIVTNYGSDIYWFERFSGHRKKISKLLSFATHYSAECQRDVELAKLHGFRGIVLPVIPNAGGFENAELFSAEMPINKRRLILIKGYDGWSGQARKAVAALAQDPGRFRGFRVVIYSCDRRTVRSITRHGLASKLDILHFLKGELAHEEMLKLMGEARIYLGVSRTDGISTSLLESIAKGAFPIQSSTSCCNEWIEDQVTGVILRDPSPESLFKKIDWALNYTEKLEQKSWEALRFRNKSRLQQANIRETALEFYDL